MSESMDHISLVKKIIAYINKQNNNFLILSDSHAAQSSPSRTSNIHGYVPDVMAFNPEMDCIYLGEAKTKNDLERRHTEDQVKTFLSYCSQKNIVFIIAVPWDLKRLAVSLLKMWQSEICLNYEKTIVIDCTYE